MNSEKQIKDNLTEIPNCCFLRKCLVGRTRESIKHVIDGLRREIDNEIYEIDNERIRTYNFISYLYWVIGEKDHAMANNKKVREMDDSNLIAITNKILFCLELEDAYEVNITYIKLEKLQTQDDFQVQCIKADAELAYYYTRLGLSMQATARMKFRKVIDDIKELNLEHVIDKHLIVLWKYGLGLITKRLSKLHSSRNAEQVSHCHQRRKEAVDAFLDVVHEDCDSKRLKAMAYAQLGEMSFAVFKDNQSLKDYVPNPYCHWDEEQFYLTALDLYNRETYVLERYGQFLRYKKRYDESENVLQKSLKIRPTSFAHHHLALTLKSKFLKELADQKKHFIRSISSSNKTITQCPNVSSVQSEQACGHHNPNVGTLFGTYTENSTPTGPQFPDNDGTMHGSGKVENPQSISSRCQDRPLSYEQNNQSASDIDSLLTTMQQASLQDKKEGGGPVNRTNLTRNVVEYISRRTEANNLQAVHVSTERVSSARDINKAQAMIKSPRKLLEIPEADSRTKDIMHHLEEALLYAENRAALYDKGLILRAMSHLDEAISVFKQLIGDETSLIYLANAYEQCGLCYNEKLQKSCIAEDELERITYNMKDCFMKSVAISAKLVAAVPNISDVWASASSLKEALVCSGKSKESLKQLATLSERLSNYEEAIAYYEDLISVEDDTKEIPKHLAGVATNRMKDNDYIGAVTVFDVARTHPDGHTCIDKKMYLKCLLEAGFQAIETRQDKQFGCKYLNTALCIGTGGTNDQSLEFIDEDCDALRGEDGTFDVFLLCCEENGRLYSLSARIWEQTKEVCGLNATLNSFDVLWGKPKVSGILDLVDKCKYFAILVSSQATDDKLYQLTLEHIVLNKTNIILLLENTETSIPDVVERFKDRIPQMVVPNTLFDESNESNSISWLKELLLRLLRVS